MQLPPLDLNENVLLNKMNKIQSPLPKKKSPIRKKLINKSHLSLSDYLHGEIFGTQQVERADATRRLRVYNFLHVPYHLENVSIFYNFD